MGWGLFVVPFCAGYARQCARQLKTLGHIDNVDTGLRMNELITTYTDSPLHDKGWFATYQWQGGAWYRGEVVRQKAHGIGVREEADGVFGGLWQDAEPVLGVYQPTAAHANMYEGHWLNGKRHGPGIETDRRGGVWMGDWVQGFRAKFGSYTNEGDQTLYQGSWKDSVPHGTGVMMYGDGWFEGQFVNGSRHGMGRRTTTTTALPCKGMLATPTPYKAPRVEHGNAIVSTYIGQWKDNVRRGFGVRTDAGGRVYRGQFIDDVPHGYGQEKETDGSLLSGHWIAGAYSASKTAEVHGSVQQALKASRNAEVVRAQITKVLDDANTVAAHANQRTQRAIKERTKARKYFDHANALVQQVATFADTYHTEWQATSIPRDFRPRILQGTELVKEEIVSAGLVLNDSDLARDYGNSVPIDSLRRTGSGFGIAGGDARDSSRNWGGVVFWLLCALLLAAVVVSAVRSLSLSFPCCINVSIQAYLHASVRVS